MPVNTKTWFSPRSMALWQGPFLWPFIGCALLCGAFLSGSVIACLVAWCPLLAFCMGLCASHPGRRFAGKTRWCHLRRTRRDCRLRGRGVLFLALLCSPVGAVGHGQTHPHGNLDGEAHSSVPGKPHRGPSEVAGLSLSLMQVSVSTTTQHTPMLTVGSIPPASNLTDLYPLEEVGSRPLTLREACQPQYVRQIAIFHGRLASGSEPSVLRIDARLFRPALDTVVMQAFGLDARAAHLLSIHSVLAELPTEQYVLQDATLPWNVHTIPVRVAASPGHTMSANMHRYSTCREIVKGLAASLGYQYTPDADLCHCAPGWFVADSQPLLVPRCDTITWTPAARVHQQRSRLRDSDQRMDRAASQSPSSTGHACIISELGIIHAELDMLISKSEQFRRWVRSFPELQPLTLRRLKYPLPELPPFQYLATAEGALGGHSLAVDLRAIDLGIIVVNANRFSTCWQVLHQLTQSHSRILQPQVLLQAVNEGDTLCFLHDLPVRPQVLLHVLVMAPRGTQCQRWPRYPSQQDVSARVRGYGMLSWVIPGYTHSGDWQRPELVLRDGDIVQSHARKPLPPARKAARRCRTPWGPGLLVASFLFSSLRHRSWTLVLLAQSIVAVQVPPARSRSPARNSDIVDVEDDTLRLRSVRVGLYAEASHPFLPTRPGLVGASGFRGLQFLCPVAGAQVICRRQPSAEDSEVLDVFRDTWPPWHCQPTPVWPALTREILHMVPCPPAPLLCVVVCGAGPVCARLLLRGMSLPQAAQALGFSEVVPPHATLMDANPSLRHGDVLVALAADRVRADPQLPTFLTIEQARHQARHHALWQLPFIVAQEAAVCLWPRTWSPAPLYLRFLQSIKGCLIWQPLGPWGQGANSRSRWDPQVAFKGHLCHKKALPQGSISELGGGSNRHSPPGEAPVDHTEGMQTVHHYAGGYAAAPALPYRELPALLVLRAETTVRTCQETDAGQPPTASERVHYAGVRQPSDASYHT